MKEPPRAVSEGDGRLPKGTLLEERYEVLSTLGHGKSGIVYKVSDRVLGGEILALKLLYPRLFMDEASLKRFQEEIFILRQLSHPNIVRVYDVDLRSPSRRFFTMEYIPGISLRELLDRMGRPFTEEECRAVLHQLLNALHFAHARGIVHRDIKPENILLDYDGVLRLGDFGCAQAEDSVRLTQTGQLVGTPTYMAPEQFSSKQLDLSVDMYALGVLTFELLTGKVPFRRKSLFEMATAHQKEPIPFEKLPAGCSSSMRAFLVHCLAKSSEERLANAAEAVELLDISAERDSSETIRKLLLQYCVDSRSSKQSRLLSAFNHLLLFALVSLGSLLFLTEEERLLQVYLDLLQVERHIGRPLWLVRMVLPVPNVRLDDHASLIAAIERGDASAVKIWCEVSVLRNGRGPGGRTITHSFIDNAEMMIPGRACLFPLIYDLPDAQGRYPLHYAVESEEVLAVRTLISAGFNPNKRNRGGQTVLETAIRTGNAVIVESLFPRSAVEVDTYDFTASGEPSIFLAIDAASPQLLKVLLDHGASVHQRDQVGRNVLMHASRIAPEAQGKVVSLLLKHGASCSARDDRGRTVQEYFRETRTQRLLAGCGSPVEAAGDDS